MRNKERFLINLFWPGFSLEAARDNLIIVSNKRKDMAGTTKNRNFAIVPALANEFPRA